MFGYIFKILKQEGIFAQVGLFFIIAFPIYFIDIYLVTVICLMALYSQILNHVAPSEKIARIYKFFGFQIQIMFLSNLLIFLVVSGLNLSFVFFVSFLQNISFLSATSYIQVGIFSFLIISGICYTNLMFFLKLKYWQSLANFNFIIISFYFLVILIMFFIIWKIFLASSIMGWLAVIFVICVWISITFSKIVWKRF